MISSDVIKCMLLWVIRLTNARYEFSYQIFILLELIEYSCAREFKTIFLAHISSKSGSIQMLFSCFNDNSHPFQTCSTIHHQLLMLKQLSKKKLVVTFQQSGRMAAYRRHQSAVKDKMTYVIFINGRKST